MTLDSVIPWGRSLAEYERMFALTDADKQRTVVGVGDGPASFNAELTARGGSVVSIDPIYEFSANEIRQRVEATYSNVVEQARQHADRYVWTLYRDADDLGAHRLATMHRFLADFEAGLSAGRYVVGGLPALPVADGQFSLALVSHLLFLYSDHLNEAFHRQSVRELLRVAAEVRLFPLLTLAGEPSPYVATVVADCRAAGLRTEIVPVSYEFQRGGHQMLRICRP